MVAVKEVKGVTEELQPKLKEQGINDSDQLLKKAKTPAGRRELAGKLGVDPKVVLELANRADLVRIKGVAGVYSNLLENAGVDTVKELSGRVPENLQAKLAQVNEEMKLANRTPTVEMVKDWVSQAKALPKMLEY
jgi:predicted flap endonuclease-1-like 5' DNA nuclease